MDQGAISTDTYDAHHCNEYTRFSINVAVYSRTWSVRAHTGVYPQTMIGLVYSTWLAEICCYMIK